jgi:hypothetical protein
MSDIEYIKQRIEEIYFGRVDEVSFITKEYEKTYSLTVTLKGVSYKQRHFEIDKNIRSVGEVINTICEKLNN